MAYKTAPILIMHQGALGDLLLSLPALYSLRMHHKKNPWTLVGNPEPLSLLQGRFYGREIFPGHHRDWAGLFQRPVKVSEAFRQFLASFERAYLFSKGFPEDLIQGLNQVGLEKTTWIPSFPDETRRIPLQTLQKEVLQSRSISWFEVENMLFVSGKDLEEARGFLDSFKRPGQERPLWAIHPGSGSPHKNWLIARFIQVAREMERIKAIQPIFLLGPVEEESDMIPFLRTPKLSIIKAPSLRILAGILSQCAGYLGNDSGVSHLAAALGLPSVVFFGPTDSFLWGPKGKAVHVLSASQSCSPCSEESRRICPDKVCLSDIMVGQVLETIRTVEDKGSGTEAKGQR
jgi:ADP-heptose:LPS heptosyltransferase